MRIVDVLPVDRLELAYRETGLQPLAGDFFYGVGNVLYACPIGAMAYWLSSGDVPIGGPYEKIVAAAGLVPGVALDGFLMGSDGTGRDEMEMLLSFQMLGVDAVLLPSYTHDFREGYAWGEHLFNYFHPTMVDALGGGDE